MRTPEQRGTTLVELMVAMALTAVAILVVAAAFPYALYGVVLGGVQTTATFLAQEAIEQARGAAYEDLAGLRFDGGVVDPADCAGAGAFREVAAFPGFRRCVAVRPGLPTATSTTITAVVEFAGPGAAEPGRTTIATVRAH